MGEKHTGENTIMSAQVVYVAAFNLEVNNLRSVCSLMGFKTDARVIYEPLLGDENKESTTGTSSSFSEDQNQRDGVEDSLHYWGQSLFNPISAPVACYVNDVQSREAPNSHPQFG